MRLKTGWTPSLRAERRDLGLALAGEMREARVGEALRLQPAERPGRRRQAEPLHFGFRFDDRLQLAQEPRVDVADGGDLLDRQAEPERLGAAQQPVRRRPAERGADGVLVVALAEAGDRDLVEAGQAGLQAAERLLQATRRRSGRSPSPRRPTSSRWSAIGSAPGNFSKAKRGILVTT